MNRKHGQQSAREGRRNYLAGMTFSERRQYAQLYKETTSGAFRELGKAGRRLKIAILQTPLFVWIRKMLNRLVK